MDTHTSEHHTGHLKHISFVFVNQTAVKLVGGEFTVDWPRGQTLRNAELGVGIT